MHDIITEQVFSTSCEEVLHQSPDKLKSTLTVQFNGEEGMVSNQSAVAIRKEYMVIRKCSLRVAEEHVIIITIYTFSSSKLENKYSFMDV